LQEFTAALETAETISEQFTCRKFVVDLHPTSYDPEMVKKTRELLDASQAVFARFLGAGHQSSERHGVPVHG
jgi:DNA-binding transcriptional regulator YiaG